MSDGRFSKSLRARERKGVLLLCLSSFLCLSLYRSFIMAVSIRRATVTFFFFFFLLLFLNSLFCFFSFSRGKKDENVEAQFFSPQKTSPSKKSLFLSFPYLLLLLYVNLSFSLLKISHSFLFSTLLILPTPSTNFFLSFLFFRFMICWPCKTQTCVACLKIIR